MCKFKILISFLLCFCCASDQKETDWWNKKAEIMVKNQLENRGIKDERVLQIMRKTPRHLFIPKNLQDVAYEDGPLPIGEGQTISQPYIVALMTELLELNGNERILEIGTGSGYQAAVLSPLVKEVYSIEVISSLAENASKKLKEMQYNNVIVKRGDGYHGWMEHAPFDDIIVTAAPKEVPQTLIDQMKVGGRLVVPVGSYFQKLKVITKLAAGKTREENIISVRFVPMVHAKKMFYKNSKHSINK